MQRCLQTVPILWSVAILVLQASVICSAAAAQNSNLFRSNLIIATSGLPGESNYLGAILLSKFFRRHIPGNPRIVVSLKRNPIRLANYAYKNMPRDGHHLFMPGKATLIQQLLNLDKVHYDARSFIWLGEAGCPDSVLVALRSVHIRTIMGLKRQHMIVPTSGIGSANHILPKLARELLGLRMTLLNDFDGGEIYTMQVMRTEILGSGAALPWEAWKAIVPQWLEDKIVTPILQTGCAELSDSAETVLSGLRYTEHPDLPQVPMLSDLVSPEDRRLVDVIWSRGMLSQGLALPPGVPKEIVTSLRQSFAETMQDPRYHAAANKQGFRVRPVNGKNMQQHVQQLFANTAGVLFSRVRHILKAGKRRHR